MCDEINGQPQVTKPAGTADPVEIGFGCFGKIEIDDDVHGLYVYTASEQVCTDEVATLTVPEVVEDSVSVRLQHLAVYVETGVA